MTLLVADDDSASIDETPESSAGTTLFWVLIVRALVLAAGILTILLTATESSNPLIWDEQSYLRILEYGYPGFDEPQNLPLIAFFPLYPMMAKPLTAFIPPHVALILVANICSLIGFGFLYLWARRLSNSKVAMLSVLVLATSVNAIFFSRALTEGPFFMFVAISLWLMHKNHLLAAAAVCGLATLTRPTGVALAVTLSLYALIQFSELHWSKRLARAAVVGLVSVWGLLAYEGFLWNRYKRPDVYFTAQHHWQDLDQGRIKTIAAKDPPRYSLRFFLDRVLTPQAWNRILAVATLGLIVIGFIRPGPVPRVLFVLPLLIFLMTALPNHGVRISSVVRYESPALPLFVLLGWWLSKVRRPSIMVGVLIASLALQLYYAVLFCRSVWVG